MNEVNQRMKALSLTAAAAFLLIRLHSAPMRTAHRLGAPHAWVARVGPDVAVATVAAAFLWLVALWVAIGLLAAVLGTAPGRIGAGAAHLAAVMIPAALRAVVVTAAGTAVLVAPLPAFAQGATASPAAPAWPVASSATAPEWPLVQPTASAPHWPAVPATSGSPAPAATPTAQSTPAVSSSPAAPSTPGAPRSAETASSPTASVAPRHRTPNSRPSTPGGGPAPAPAGGDTVTVAPGNSLWVIAAHRLGPHADNAEIAVEWPYWYSANRKVIGSDPGLLRPGTTLRVPDDHGTAR